MVLSENSESSIYFTTKKNLPYAVVSHNGVDVATCVLLFEDTSSTSASNLDSSTVLMSSLNSSWQVNINNKVQKKFSIDFLSLTILDYLQFKILQCLFFFYIFIYTHVYICLYIYTYMYIFIHVYLYIYVCVCVYVYVNLSKCFLQTDISIKKSHWWKHSGIKPRLECKNTE